LFDIAMDSKLRGCDIVKLRIGDLVSGSAIRNWARAIRTFSTGRLRVSVTSWICHPVLQAIPITAGRFPNFTI
jgi:hypothetical protein